MSLSRNVAQSKHIFTNFFLLVNTFVWYFFAFDVLRNLVSNVEHSDGLIIWALNFGGVAVSALISTKIASFFKRQSSFIYMWIIMGFLSSLTPLFMNGDATYLLFISVMSGVSFGLGMPICMEYFAQATTVENRGRFGGASFFSIAFGVFLLNIISVGNLLLEVLISAVWRGIGLLALFLVKPLEITSTKKVSSYISILSKRDFLFYIIPWFMFCLVNYTTAPILNDFFGEDFHRFSSIVESIVISFFAVIAGAFADIVGRKRLAIVGFVTLGLGYAILGIYPRAIFGWYFYTLVDGCAWGILCVIFLIVLWGDLAYDSPSGNFYALGGLPFLLSNFIQIIISPYIRENVSVYTIFSLASFFLFLAVLPLIHAPETLPEKHIRERELKNYIRKAKKVREKFA